MENNKSFNLDTQVASLLVSCQNLAEQIKVRIITEEVLGAGLFWFSFSPLKKYLLQKGSTEEACTEAAKEILSQIEFNEDTVETTYLKIGDYFVYFTQKCYEIFRIALDSAKRNYARDYCALGDMVAAYIEMFEDLYLKGLNIALPQNNLVKYPESTALAVIDEPFVIPRELSSFVTVLNTKYDADETECLICGREKEVTKLRRILMKRTKRNAILVGEAGVGKTAIVEKLTWMIVTGIGCPEKFKNSIVLNLNLTSIVAGTMYRGTAEKRFMELVSFLENNPNCILFIDEIHNLLGAGACREGDLDLANALKPLLARGETQVIGATTIAEYEKFFSRDAALKRRFEKIDVEEPSIEEVYPMIKNQVKNLQVTHKTTISDKLVKDTIFYASCYNFTTRNPDRTIDLLDKAMVVAEENGRSYVTKNDILENFDQNVEQYSAMSEQAKLALAYHEAGHYIIHRFAPELIDYKITAISIIPADDYVGVNVFEQVKSVIPSRNKDYFKQQIASKLSGRIAEKMISNQLTAGASSDLAHATALAKDYITRYGMYEELTQDRVYLRESKNPMYNDELISKLNGYIDTVLDEAHKYAEELLNEKKVYLEVLAKALIENGMMSRMEIDELFDKCDKELKNA